MVRHVAATTNDKCSYTVQAVATAVDILEAITDAPSPPTVQSLAHKFGLSRSKAFRLLATLESKGLVEREDFSGSYRLGLHAVELAQKFLKSVALLEYGRPVMEKLARKHDEAVYMAVAKGDEVVFLDMVDSAQQVKTVPIVGKRFPFFTNASGKIIKAQELRELPGKPFKSRGRKKNNIPDLEQLQSELNAIRTSGFAVDIGGLGDGIISVAVAVKDYAGKVIGALTLLGPSVRMAASRLEEEIIPSLLEGAEMLSMKFGYARI